MNIVVIGAGGVGGYFGGKLAQAGYNVTFVVRGKHLEAIQQNGLEVKSTKEDFKIHPKATDDINSIENPDLIILGTKSWQVKSVAKSIKPILTKDTKVLPLQNGADNADKLLEILPKENVLGGLCKIVSKIENPGVINHFAFEPEIIFGPYESHSVEELQYIKEAFDKANFKNKLSNNIRLDIWRKFQFITSVSGIASLTRASFGVMASTEGIRDIIFQTAQEVVQIANAKGIELTTEDTAVVLKAFESSSYNTTASMQRDIMAGKPSELENFNGYIVKQGNLLGIQTPVNAFIYHCLLPQENLARN